MLDSAVGTSSLRYQGHQILGPRDCFCGVCGGNVVCGWGDRLFFLLLPLGGALPVGRGEEGSGGVKCSLQVQLS